MASEHFNMMVNIIENIKKWYALEMVIYWLNPFWNIITICCLNNRLCQCYIEYTLFTCTWQNQISTPLPDYCIKQLLETGSLWGSEKASKSLLATMYVKQNKKGIKVHVLCPNSTLNTNTILDLHLITIHSMLGFAVKSFLIVFVQFQRIFKYK